jgi:hypothetical protein
MFDRVKNAVTVSLSALMRLERDIQPPMRQAITLPVLINGSRSGMIIYVATSPFGEQLTDTAFAATAEIISQKLCA